MNKDKPILSVRALCKDFRRPNGSLFTVLENINLDIYDGELLAIVGLSGSGKSTLLRCMADLLAPDRGTVTHAQPTAENLQVGAFVFQSFALFPWMTIRENIAVSMNRLKKIEQEERTDKIIQMVGLKGFEDAYPRELSGGMRQRVSFARAMVSDPMILFMDEPFSALDPLTSESLRAELLRIWLRSDKKIRSGVLVTHRFEEALQLADRIVILSSNPGTIATTIEITLPKPRAPNSEEYKALEKQLETAFGQLHLDKVTDEGEHVKVKPTRVHRAKPLIKTSLTLVEGLVSRLSSEAESMDIYDLCEDMGQSVDQVLPAAAAAEMLGFITTPGTQVVLTPNGHIFATERDSNVRMDLMHKAILNLPLVSSIYDMVEKAGEEGLPMKVALNQIVGMLPFEDHDAQFQTLVRWCRHANLLIYNADEERLFIPH